MGLKKHILRGLIEQYMIGMMEKEDAIEFEKLLAQSPEMQEALKSFEAEVDMFVKPNMTEPPGEVWDIILEWIKKREYEGMDEIISSYLTTNDFKKKTRKRYCAGIVFTALLVMMLIAGFFLAKSIYQQKGTKVLQLQKSNALKTK